GTMALGYTDLVQEKILEIKSSRATFVEFLETMPNCRVLPSQTNFVTFSAPWAQELHYYALEKEWNFKYYPSGKLSNHIRMAIGRKEEMEMMKEMIRNIATAE
ncbi:MAG: histidinol-phosphate aminotransferase family protein, partial [Streptococcus suis]